MNRRIVLGFSCFFEEPTSTSARRPALPSPTPASNDSPKLVSLGVEIFLHHDLSTFVVEPEGNYSWIRTKLKFLVSNPLWIFSVDCFKFVS